MIRLGRLPRWRARQYGFVAAGFCCVAGIDWVGSLDSGLWWHRVWMAFAGLAMGATAGSLTAVAGRRRLVLTGEGLRVHDGRRLAAVGFLVDRADVLAVEHLDAGDPVASTGTVVATGAAGSRPVPNLRIVLSDTARVRRRMYFGLLLRPAGPPTRERLAAGTTLDVDVRDPVAARLAITSWLAQRR